MRRVVIVLQSRSTDDSGRLLQDIADAFPNDDMEVRISPQGDSLRSKDEKPPTEAISPVVMASVEAQASETLEEETKVLEKAGPTSSEKVKSSQSNLKKWSKKLAWEGIKATVQALIKDAIS